MRLARIVKREGPILVPLRTEGAVIIPKLLREQLGLRPGDLLEIDVQGVDLILRPRPVRRFVLSGVPAASVTTLVGALNLGGDAVEDKEQLYRR